MFEVDVQLRGGRVVCSHYLPLPDRWRLPPIERDNWRLRRAPGRDPDLDAVLAMIPERCDVLLDPKHHPGMSSADLCVALAGHVADSGRPSRFVVSTSDPGLLADYRHGGVRTWRSIGNRDDLSRALAGGTLPEEGVSIRHSLLDAETISSLHSLAGIIVAWTVNARSRAEQLVRLGVDGVTTDRLDVLGLGRNRGT